jgi:hypothetical protein
VVVANEGPGNATPGPSSKILADWIVVVSWAGLHVAPKELLPAEFGEAGVAAVEAQARGCRLPSAAARSQFGATVLTEGPCDEH